MYKVALEKIFEGDVEMHTVDTEEGIGQERNQPVHKF